MKRACSYLDDAGLTPRGRMILRFLVLDSARLILATKTFAADAVGGGHVGAATCGERFKSPREIEARIRALKAEFAGQIKRLIARRPTQPVRFSDITPS